MKAATCAAVLAVLALSAAAASADEVLLANGDRLTGTVVRKSGNVLTLRTTYAGEIAIDWRSVVSIQSQGALDVLLVGESSPVRGPLATAGPDSVVLGGRATPVPLREIAFINPLPEEGGAGWSWHGHANVSATRTAGNSPATRDYGDADVTARAKDWRLGASGRANRTSQAGVTNAQSWLASANIDRFTSPGRFRYVRASFEHDRFRDLDLRTALGGGYGLQFVETERSDVSLRGGLDYVAEDRINAPVERYPALGWGIKARHRLGRGDLELFHDQEGFWDLRDARRITLRSRTGLRVPIIAKLSASAQVNVDWEGDPAPGRKATDSTLLLGLTYSF
jgi:putative salt-induced outer membrane protein YdiY